MRYVGHYHPPVIILSVQDLKHAKWFKRDVNCSDSRTVEGPRDQVLADGLQGRRTIGMFHSDPPPVADFVLVFEEVIGPGSLRLCLITKGSG